MSHESGKKLQRIPSKFEKDREPQPMRAEAIAMRRIVVEMGYWLSPMLKDYPIPVLTEWEKTVDLTALSNSEKVKNTEDNRRPRHNVLSRFEAVEEKPKKRRGVDATRKRKIQTLQELEEERRQKEIRRRKRKKNK